MMPMLGTSLDCPGGIGNGLLDECEPDCDGNNFADSCDCELGTTPDCNSDGIPDDCPMDPPIDCDRVRACPFRVRFGEVLTSGQEVDPGNQNRADTAVVYTGSFRAPAGCPERGFVVDSVNNIINTLSLTCAHEIGHLLGLNHTALEGLMAQRPSLAFQRQLRFQRSQIRDGITDNVITTVIQDPQIYFENIFSP